MTFFGSGKAENDSLKMLEDDIQTGSIRPSSEVGKPGYYFKSLTDEDWRRARAALAVAVDPHGSPDRVLWDNPETQAKGSFAPEGAPFVKNDDICRNFKTMLSEQGEPRSLVGTACRPSGGEWDITELKPASAVKTADGKAPAVKAKAKPAVKKIASATP